MNRLILFSVYFFSINSLFALLPQWIQLFNVYDHNTVVGLAHHTTLVKYYYYYIIISWLHCIATEN